jgi:uncharacterized membrane protein YczE
LIESNIHTACRALVTFVFTCVIIDVIIVVLVDYGRVYVVHVICTVAFAILAKFMFTVMLTFAAFTIQFIQFIIAFVLCAFNSCIDCISNFCPDFDLHDFIAGIYQFGYNTDDVIAGVVVHVQVYAVESS